MKLKEKIQKFKEKMYKKTIEDLSCCHWGREKLTKEEVQELLKLIDENFSEK